MTDIERERLNAICEVAGIEDIENLSDGFHTFRQLYYQRMILFATIVKQNKDKAWKSLRHEDGELCFGGGWFIIGIDTPEGSYTYHYEDNFYSFFDCEELECAKHWDGHTEKDVTRLLSLPSAQQWIPCSERLPEEKQDVLLLMPQNMEIGFWEDVLCDGERTWYVNSGNGYFIDMDVLNGYDYHPIAWMPMPEPWEGENNG